jgi:hypothetical protein
MAIPAISSRKTQKNSIKAMAAGLLFFTSCVAYSAADLLPFADRGGVAVPIKTANKRITKKTMGQGPSQNPGTAAPIKSDVIIRIPVEIFFNIL